MAKIKELNLSEGVEVSAPTQIFTAAYGIKAYASSAAYVAAKGSAAEDGDIFYNTTDDLLNLYADGSWISIGQTYETFYYEDSWDGSTSTKTYTVDGSGSGTGKVSDARKAMWVFKSVSDDFLQMDAEITATDSASVTITFAGNIPSGTYTIKGVQ